MSNADGFDNNPGGAPPPPPPLDPPAPRYDAPDSSGGAGGIGGTGLDRNVAAGLACLFSVVGGIVFLVIEKKDRYVRFYAMQSLLLGAASIAFSILMQIAIGILGFIPVIGWIVSLLLIPIAMIVGLAYVALWLITTIKAFSGGPEWEIPVLGAIARKQLDKM